MKNPLGLIKKAICSLVTGADFSLKGRTLFIGGLSFFLMSQSVMATGSIKGKVIDKELKEGLTGANVVLENTSMGASADLDGNFVIHGVPAGEHTIKISYIGYTSVTLAVTVVDGADVQVEASLEPSAIQGEVVVVTVQAQGQIQAINQQLASDKIANIVSEARIQELPDFNAAQAISRLPGVSTTNSSGEAQKVVIRGLAPQFNAVAVGGISLASTGNNQIGATSLPGLTSGAINNDRSVDLTMVTPYMIKSIEVYKSLTPDMNANAIGGYVNMILREAPPEFHTDLMLQTGYTNKTNNYGNYRAVLSASNRFFKEKLGVYVLGNIESYDRSSDNMSATYVQASAFPRANGYRTVRVTGVTLNRHNETRRRFGGNLILDYAIPNGSIKMVNMFSRLNSINNDYRTILNYGSTNYDIDHSYQERNSNTDLAVNSLEFTKDLKVISMEIKVANTYSMNRFPLSGFYSFVQNNAISRQHSVTGDTNKIPEALASYANYGSDTTTLLTSTSLFSSTYRENDQVYKSDFKVPLHLGTTVSGFFKFGGEFRYNYRTNDQSTPYVSINRGSNNSATGINRAVVDYIATFYPNLRYGSTGQLMANNFTATDPRLTNSFLDNKFGGVYWACDPNILNRVVNFIRENPALRAIDSQGGWFDGAYQQLPNDYKFIEKYYAAYLMSQLDIGSRLMIVGGARYEENQGLFDAFNMRDERNPRTQVYFPVTATSWNHYWLPMIQGKYEFSVWGDARYSYSQTLARPDYTQLSPHFNIGADSPRQIWSGNPKLKPAQAYNHDLLLTIHSNTIGLLSVGGFYKEIKNFAYNTSYQVYSKSVYDRFNIKGLDSLNSFSPFLTSADAGSTVNTTINSRYTAYVRGIEIDLQTRFWYLRAPFKGMVFGINYTRVWSQATYPVYDVRAVRGVITWYADSSRSGRLVLQPNDIVNGYIGYDYKGFSGRVSCVFQGNSLTYSGAFPEQDGYSKDYFRVDVSIRQMLPWKGLQMFLDMNSLNNPINKSAQLSIDGFTSQNDYGLTVNLGVRYIL